MLTTIYRWELQFTKEGPYRPLIDRFNNFPKDCRHNIKECYYTLFNHNDDSHPLPNCIDYDDNPYFGFKSLEQMSNWFKDFEQSMLIRSGYRLVEYIVNTDKLIYDNKQIIFYEYISKKYLI